METKMKWAHKPPHLLDYKFARGHIVTRLERATYDERDVRDKGICTWYSYIWVLDEHKALKYVYHKNRPNIRYVRNDYLGEMTQVE